MGKELEILYRTYKWSSSIFTFHIHTYKFMPVIHTHQVFRKHKPHTTTIYNTTRLIFKENSKLKRKTIVFKTNFYAYLKFNKEVNRITNIKFWAKSPLYLRLFLKIPINTTITSLTISIISNKKLWVLTGKVCTISCNMKYETWASSMHWLWIVKYSNPSLSLSWNA